jgi:hypothetical protein
LNTFQPVSFIAGSTVAFDYSLYLSQLFRITSAITCSQQRRGRRTRHAMSLHSTDFCQAIAQAAIHNTICNSDSPDPSRSADLHPQTQPRAVLYTRQEARNQRKERNSLRLGKGSSESAGCRVHIHRHNSLVSLPWHGQLLELECDALDKSPRGGLAQQKALHSVCFGRKDL